MPWWDDQPCGRAHIPPGAIQAFTDRDWSVIVPDTVGCGRDHEGRERWNDHGRTANTLVPLTRKLKADGYGPLTIIGGDISWYMIHARGPDVPQLEVGVAPGRVMLPSAGPEPGQGYRLEDTLPMEWLMFHLGGTPEEYPEAWERFFEWQGGPHPEWTFWAEPGGGTYVYEWSDEIWVRIADWLEPRFEAAMERRAAED